LKETYGDNLCFHSAVDNQQTLGCDGTGFIIGPCHNLQPVTPIENILALYQAANE
jgi:uroporphyrinogen decarboxylase